MLPQFLTLIFHTYVKLSEDIPIFLGSQVMNRDPRHLTGISFGGIEIH